MIPSLTTGEPTIKVGTRWVSGLWYPGKAGFMLRYSPKEPRYEAREGATSTNDASQTVKPGSEDRCECPSLSVGPTVIGTGSRSAGSVSPKHVGFGTSATMLAIIAAMLSLSTHALAQEPHAGPLDGSLLQDIREARQDVRSLRDSIAEGREESRAWRGLLERDHPFLDRIGTLVWLTFITAIIGLVAYCLRQVADVLKAFKDVFGKPEVKT